MEAIPRPVELSIIVPTYCERDNVEELVRRLHAGLGDIAWEAIFVDDDSPDGTADLLRALAAGDARVRCLQRIGRKGLSSACVEGMLSSSAPYLAVIDADLQHDETLLPTMLACLRGGEVDIAIGSRYAPGGRIGDWSAERARVSRLATRMSRLVIPSELSDPMSGFFMVRRDAFRACVRRMSGIGFKILFDLFASSAQPLRYREFPYTFRRRQAGQSKLDHRVAWDYGMLLIDKLIGRIVPARFVSFALIGGLGAVVHLGVLSALYRTGFASFVAGQTAATGIAMVFNFYLNNLLTFRDQRLTGLRWFRGLASFMLGCSIGALANVGIAHYAFERETGWVASAIAGILVGAVWNYVVAAFYTWGRARR